MCFKWDFSVQVWRLCTLCCCCNRGGAWREGIISEPSHSCRCLLAAPGSSRPLSNTVPSSSHISPGTQGHGEVLGSKNSDSVHEGLKTSHLRVDNDWESVFWRTPRCLFNMHASASNLLVCRLRLSSSPMPPSSRCHVMSVKCASLLCLSSESLLPRFRFHQQWVRVSWN